MPTVTARDGDHRHRPRPVYVISYTAYPLSTILAVEEGTDCSYHGTKQACASDGKRCWISRTGQTGVGLVVAIGLVLPATGATTIAVRILRTRVRLGVGRAPVSYTHLVGA